MRLVNVQSYAQWSICDKLPSQLLLLGVATFAVTGTIAYIKCLSALRREVLKQLVAITRDKRFRIESYYQTIWDGDEPIGVFALQLSTAYDLWGDTVNLASRMESSGMPGTIQVTHSVHEQLKDSFDLETRGVAQVKGEGEIEAWILHGELKAVEVPR